MLSLTMYCFISLDRLIVIIYLFIGITFLILNKDKSKETVLQYQCEHHSNHYELYLFSRLKIHNTFAT